MNAVEIEQAISDLALAPFDPAEFPYAFLSAFGHKKTTLNDEVLERIYIGRRFKNDTERLEKLFELYTKMTAETASKASARKTTRGKKA